MIEKLYKIYLLKKFSHKSSMKLKNNNTLIYEDIDEELYMIYTSTVPPKNVRK